VYGEVPWAWIESTNAVTVPPEELRGLCRSQLASFKVPRRFLPTVRLPTTANGKVQKFKLQHQAMRELGLSAGPRVLPTDDQ
jgi:fatty-acyl-CoA synthase